MKDFIRKIFFDCNIPVTTNLYNDILLKKIIKRVLKPSDNTIDIGCHKGEILELFLKYSPSGTHFAFEPIPYFYDKLKKKYSNVNVLPYALSDESGTSEFYWIKDNPAYSGLSKRKFSEKNADIQSIKVDLKTLDDVIPKDIPIHFIKIDVEGAEMKVLKGGEGLIQKYHPIIAFEFGLGGSDYYNTYASDIFDFFHQHQYSLYSFENFLHHQKPYTKAEFEKVYQDNIIYNFVAV